MSINLDQALQTFIAEARELLGDAKKMVAAGKSPAKEKARDKARVKDAETFGAWAEKWLQTGRVPRCRSPTPMACMRVSLSRIACRACPKWRW